MARSHQRTRSSIDQTLEDLLADLDDGQLEALLQEANSTGDTHVAVAQAITMFERPMSPPLSPRASMLAARASQPPAPRKFLTSLSPRKGSLRRRTSNRTSSAPEPRTPKTQKRTSLVLARHGDAESSLDDVLARVSIDSRRPMSPLRPMSSSRPMSPKSPKSPKRNSYIMSSPKRASVRLDFDFGFGEESLMPSEPRSPKSPGRSSKRNSHIMANKNVAPILPDFDFGFDGESSIDLAAAAGGNDDVSTQRASTRATSPRPTSPLMRPANNNSTKTSRAYKRISRPTAFFADSLNGSMNGNSTPQIHDLLAAYFSTGSTTSSTSSASSTNGSSPITPRSCSGPFAASPLIVSWDQAEAEGPDSPWEDLFEPTPGRLRTGKAGKSQKSYGGLLGLGFGGMNPMREPSRNISGIFEVLGPIETPAAAR